MPLGRTPSAAMPAHSSRAVAAACVGAHAGRLGEQGWRGARGWGAAGAGHSLTQAASCMAQLTPQRTLGAPCSAVSAEVYVTTSGCSPLARISRNTRSAASAAPHCGVGRDAGGAGGGVSALNAGLILLSGGLLEIRAWLGNATASIAAPQPARSPPWSRRRSWLCTE